MNMNLDQIFETIINELTLQAKNKAVLGEVYVSVTEDKFVGFKVQHNNMSSYHFFTGICEKDESNEFVWLTASKRYNISKTNANKNNKHFKLAIEEIKQVLDKFAKQLIQLELRKL